MKYKKVSEKTKDELVAGVINTSCNRCGICVYLCPHIEMDKFPVINQEKCIGCGNCVNICPQDALYLDSKE